MEVVRKEGEEGEEDEGEMIEDEEEVDKGAVEGGGLKLKQVRSERQRKVKCQSRRGSAATYLANGPTPDYRLSRVVLTDSLMLNTCTVFESLLLTTNRSLFLLKLIVFTFAG